MNKKQITLINIGSCYLPFQKSIPALEVVHAEHNYFNMLLKYIRAGVICEENTGQALINIQVVPPNNTKNHLFAQRCAKKWVSVKLRTQLAQISLHVGQR